MNMYSMGEVTMFYVSSLHTSYIHITSYIRIYNIDQLFKENIGSYLRLNLCLNIFLSLITQWDLQLAEILLKPAFLVVATNI